MPDSGIAGGLYLHPLIIRALPGNDRLGETIQYQNTLCRRSEKNKMAASRLRLDHRLHGVGHEGPLMSTELEEQTAYSSTG